MTDRQENSKPLDIKNSFIQDQTASVILKGVSFAELPDTLTFDNWLPQLTAEISDAVSKNKTNRIQKFAELRKRIEKYYADSQNPEDQVHLAPQTIEVRTEFSIKIYSTQEGVVKGNLHKGSEGFILHQPQRDGIPDNQTSVNIHNHPTNTSFSREDKVSSLALDPDVPQNCIHIITTPNYIFLSFPTKESPRLIQEFT